MTYTVEDILDKVVSSAVDLSTSDKTILFSIARQVKKNIGLTDRQHRLVKEKFLNYKHELERIGFSDLETNLSNLRIPLRSVDRSKTITIVGHSEMLGPNKIYEAHKDKWQWMNIRFPFSKKTIVLIDQLMTKHKKDYYHEKGSLSHYIKLTETTIESVVDAFADKNFEIDQKLLDLNQRIKDIKMKKSDYVPGLYNDRLLNFKPAGLELIEKELGTYDQSKTLKLYDRRRRYGIGHIECERPDGLIGDIAFRKDSVVTVDPDTYEFSKIANAVLDLDRLPVLAVIDENQALEQVRKIYNAFSAHVPNEQQSVLFRVDKTPEYNVNNFIKDNQLNNWVDKNTKIVYISKDKLPKVVLRSGWQPVCVLALSKVMANTYVATYISDVSDLTICVDKECELFGRKKYNGFM